MYNNKLAMAIKVGGKVLREKGDTVLLPFGSEYSVLIKNLHPYRVKLSIFIDGNDISDGATSFILDGGSEMDIERFLPRGNHNKGNRFKFIERTESIEQHRGIKIDDSLVRVEYEFEREPAKIVPRPILVGYDYDPYYNPNRLPHSWPHYKDLWHSSGIGSGVSSSNMMAASSVLRGQPSNASLNNLVASGDAGITVAGSVSDQKFSHTSGIISDGVKHSMVLKLVGAIEEVAVVRPVTVSSKLYCSSCGKSNKSTASFCGACGTSLDLVA